MKLGIVAHKENEKARELLAEVKGYVEDKGHEVSEENLEGSDVVVTLGGDGTLLHASCKNIDLEVPFVGINVGTLGFLTAAESEDWRQAIDRIIAGQYVISERMTIESEIGDRISDVGYRFRAVNEVVVKAAYRVMDLEVLVNGEKFMAIVGDGVIVSTQTGSTGYSLSSGGPIVDPELDCFLITPINAVGLPIPSVVLPPKDKIEIKVKEGEDISLVIDGQEHTKVSKDQSVKVSKGEKRVKFGYFDEHHFLKALNGKFGLSSRMGS